MNAKEIAQAMNRRQFLGGTTAGLGSLALSSLVAESPKTATAASLPNGQTYDPQPHFTPKAKRVIYLFQSGAPSQFETFDYKPKLQELRGQELPASVRMGQRLTTMTSGQTSFPMVNSIFSFSQHGRQGAWLSDLLPHTAKVADDLCIIRSMYTEAINHDPAITFFQTGSQIAGRPSFGSWIHYGLGSANENLPAFVVLVTPGKGDQPLYSRLWGNGFLDSRFQG